MTTEEEYVFTTLIAEIFKLKVFKLSEGCDVGCVEGCIVGCSDGCSLG